MIFKQLFDKATSTYTYLLGDPDSGKAILIDPVLEQADRDLALIAELGLTLALTLETHVHADHVTASGTLRERTGSRSVVSAAAGVTCIDISAEHGDVIRLGSLELEARHTPGHTDGCVSYVLRGDTPMVFTGDTLLIRGCGRTDFQAGDASTLYASVHEQLFTLPAETLVYPGHDYRGHTVSTIGEERAHNPRLRDGISREAFVEIMNDLRLADPKQMDVALPANMACGRRPFAKVTPSQLGGTSGYRVIDVRHPDEFDGELGHIDGAQLVPLDTLKDASEAWPRDGRLLMVCRSGRRSAKACEFLVSQGFQDVTNLEGGMLAWNQSGQPSTTCG